MKKKLKFKIVTPERLVYENEIDQVTLPTMEGEITILPDHAPLIAVLKPGSAEVKIGKEELDLAVSGGLIEVKMNNVTVLADTAERAEEIDIKRAEEAREWAESILKEKVIPDYTTTALLERQLARIKVARKHLSRRRMTIEDQ